MPARVKVTVDWDAVKSDPVEFAKHMLTSPDGKPVILHDGQAEVLRGITRYTSIVTGRQWGKTTAIAVDATWFGVTHANRVIMVVAPSLEQAKLIFNDILQYFQKAPLKYLLAEKPRQSPFPEIVLTNGTRYLCRGTNSAQYVRGNRPHRVYGDEAQFMKDAVITDVIEPAMLVTGAQPDSALVLTTTPFGRGPFYDLYRQGLEPGHDPAYASFQFSCYDNPLADRENLERIKARYGEDSLIWRSEYLGLFDSDDRAVFKWDDIKAMYEHWPHDDEFPIRPVHKHRYVQGVDLANMRDYFVANVVDDTDPLNCELVRLDRHQQKGYPYYKRLVRANYATYRPRTIVDSTSLGQSVAQDLDDIGAEGYAMSSDVAKWEIIQELARMTSEHRLLIPPKREIIDELRFFQYRITTGKHLTAQASKGHDDIVMSLALTAHLCAVPRTLGLMRAASVPAAALPRASALSPLQRAPRPAPIPEPVDPWAALFEEDAEEHARWQASLNA